MKAGKVTVEVGIEVNPELIKEIAEWSIVEGLTEDQVDSLIVILKKHTKALEVG